MDALFPLARKLLQGRIWDGDAVSIRVSDDSDQLAIKDTHELDPTQARKGAPRLKKNKHTGYRAHRNLREDELKMLPGYCLIEIASPAHGLKRQTLNISPVRNICFDFQMGSLQRLAHWRFAIKDEGGR
ncbi:hypothetical protein BJ912DRAFT_959014 [Pholiota molesta]|nr:hypothetical protein BJ912DRAFT_959014 [Pholiota molesta]